MTNRIYKATVINGTEQTHHLVKAASRGQVRQHVSNKFISVKPATADDMAELLGTGHTLESYVAPVVRQRKKKDQTPTPVFDLPGDAQ